MVTFLDVGQGDAAFLVFQTDALPFWTGDEFMKAGIPRNGNSLEKPADFVQAVHPHLGLFSQSGSNPQGLPRISVLELYLNSGTILLRTNEQ